MTQSNVINEPVVGRAGMRADTTKKDDITRFATSALNFGVFVSVNNAGDPDKEVKLPAATGDVTALGLGFILEDELKEPGAYADGDVVQVMRTGRIWVAVEDAVTAGNEVFIRFVAGGGEEFGAVRSDADGTDAVAYPGATFFTSTTAAGIAQVELK